MQTHALLNVDRELLAPFFKRVPELFDKYHNLEQNKPEIYEELLYKIHRPLTSDMLDMIDDWMGLERRFGSSHDCSLHPLELATPTGAGWCAELVRNLPWDEHTSATAWSAGP